MIVSYVAILLGNYIVYLAYHQTSTGVVELCDGFVCHSHPKVYDPTTQLQIITIITTSYKIAIIMHVSHYTCETY